MKLLNIGCGNTYHKDWINLDLFSSEYVRYHNIRNKLPFRDNTLDAVYHSHVLEHLRKPEAGFFISECYRVLKKGGIIRVVIPDLEKIVREYLRNLDEFLRTGDSIFAGRYKFNKIEIFDQIVRQVPGGEMLEIVREGRIDPEYLKERTGEELIDFYNKRDRGWKKILKGIRNMFNSPQRSGEAHRWMYDRVDLKLLLEDHGFVSFRITNHMNSKIPGWTGYRLDLSGEEGRPRKPDSLYIEAVK